MTHTGRRRENEDAFALSEPLFVVADGMGDAGAEASALAVQTLVDHFDGDIDPLLGFEAAIARAAQAIDAASATPNMAATLAALFVGDDGVTVAHVGDSRIYRLRRRRLTRLTRDHSVLSDMEMTLGQFVPVRASHPMGSVVTRALGNGGDPRPDVRFVDISRRDRYLLCTDGLSDALPQAEIRALLMHGTPDDAAQALLDAALAEGARDNVTLIVVDVR